MRTERSKCTNPRRGGLFKHGKGYIPLRAGTQGLAPGGVVAHAAKGAGRLQEMT